MQITTISSQNQTSKCQYLANSSLVIFRIALLLLIHVPFDCTHSEIIKIMLAS